ncbi:MAG: DUF4396 domain-containing protein [Paracoccaceae bacterium]|jgi:hypothetical protein
MAREHGEGSILKAALLATLHCTIGCTIGEVAGLAIGVSLGLGPWWSMAIGTVLAFISGLGLATIPLARSQKIALSRAFSMIWMGETASIAAMELAMNGADYLLGGASVASVFAPRFWWAMGLAIPVGFAAAFPVNFHMIRRGLGHHHH